MPAPELLIAAYGARYDQARAAASAAVGQLWDAVGGLDDQAADEFVRQAVTIVLGAERTTASLTAAYLSQLIAELASTPPAPARLDLATVTGRALRAAPPAEVYARPVVTARKAIAEGRSLVEALAAGRARATSTAATDVALAHRAAAVAVMAGDDRVVGYRRVLTGRSCALCATASTQRYHRHTLAPIHAHCDCRVAPLVGDQDPGQVINDDLLDRLREAGGSRYWRQRGVTVDEHGHLVVGDDGRRLEVATKEHGELGPVLVDRDHHFSGEGDLAA